MAKAVGLDAGSFEIKLVELDGSFRRPRLTKVSIERVPAAGGETPAERAQVTAAAAVQAAKDANVGRDGVVSAFPCRAAVLRHLTIPFVGDDAIRKVIKFEAEGSIHSHSVDDMVIDFETLERLDHESRVLIAAAPKASLRLDLEALESAGMEPERVDLDTMALYRVAQWAGCFGEEVAEAAAAQAEGEVEEGSLEEELPITLGTAVPGQGARARVVIDVGARSTKLLAVVGGRLLDMRALRLGDDGLAAEVAEHSGLSVDAAREAVAAILEGADEFVIDDGEIASAVAPQAELGAEPAAEPAAESDASLPVAAERAPVTAAFVEECRSRYLARLRRELLRFLAGLPRVAGVEQVHVTGGGSALPGVSEVIAEVFECPVHSLDVLGRLSHNLDEDEAAAIGPRIAVAVGLALAPMGSRDGFDFRQEEFAYRRRFDRIKFPLAIAAMLAVFLPFLYGVRMQKELNHLALQYGELYEVTGAEADGGGRRGAVGMKATFWGYTGFLMQPGGDYGVLRYLGNEEYETLTRKLVQADTFERLPILRRHLEDHLTDEQEKTGVYQDLQLPSGVYVLSWFGRVVRETESRLGSFLIPNIDLNVAPVARNRSLQFRVMLRGENYRERFELLREAFAQHFSDPTCPFEDFRRGGSEDVFNDPGSVGAEYQINLALKEHWDTEVGE